MTEICRVGILLVILLAYVFWLPSGVVQGDDVDSEGPDRTGEPYYAGDLRIVDLLTIFFSSGCKVALAETDKKPAYIDGGPGGSEHFSNGHRRIEALLSAFFLSDCKGSIDAHLEEALVNSEFNVGEKQIIKILSTYFTAGCSEAKAAAKEARDLPNSKYARGEMLIVNLLSSYFASGCEGSEVFKSVSANETVTSSGCHVQFFVLELFLPIAGVYLTQVNL